MGLSLFDSDSELLPESLELVISASLLCVPSEELNTKMNTFKLT